MVATWVFVAMKTILRRHEQWFQTLKRSNPVLPLHSSVWLSMVFDNSDSDIQSEPNSIATELKADRRGQSAPQIIGGLLILFLILFLIGGTLIAAAEEVQTGLAETPLFTDFTAGVFALAILIVLAAKAVEAV